LSLGFTHDVFGRYAFSICAALACASLLAACESREGASVVPRAASFTKSHDVVAGARGMVTLFDDTFGDPTPAGITTGPDGALWFTDPGNDVIGRITTEGSYTLQMSAGVEISSGITTGPDGNLWFTSEQADAYVGRITPNGVVTLFKDFGGSFPQGITAGPDGALWFAESNGSVGRMTTKGKVKHFSVAPSDAELQGIVTGPDGRLWVTQYVVGGSRFSNKVIRVTTSGKSTSYTVGSGPESICVGPDKALWFAQANAMSLGRLTTGGSFEEFSIGNGHASPSGIAAGPDGALWFTEFSGSGGIGRMTTSGKVKSYAVPGSAPALQQITAGPDGAMWFASGFGPPAIGRITTSSRARASP
jgi:virginiamycin B lyase